MHLAPTPFARFLLLAAVIMAWSPPSACGDVLHVDGPAALTAAVSKARPGDDVVIEDGVWRDVHVRIVGNGASSAPIRIRPATPGGLQITGVSRVRIGGSHLVVSGLRLRNIRDVSDWFQFREDSKNPARHCRTTDCVFEEDEEFDPGRMDSRWVGIYGEDNEFDHCRVEGKKSRGTSVAIWLQEGLDASHHVHHNQFGYRPPLGRNGGETIRVGDSKTLSINAACLFEKNIFERCNGEAECISNKSCENVYRFNLFREVQGTLSLRHGHRCRVEANVFLGSDVKHTGGIRIIGEDHLVRGNYLANLGGTKARGALVLQNGIPNSPASGYSPVRRAVVRDNHIIRCRESLVIGYADKDSPSSIAVPEDCIFRGNAFLADADRTVVTEHQAARNTQWESNIATGKLLGIDEPAAGGLRFHPGAPPPDLVPPVPELKFAQSAGPSWDREK